MRIIQNKITFDGECYLNITIKYYIGKYVVKCKPYIADGYIIGFGSTKNDAILDLYKNYINLILFATDPY